MTFNPFNQAEHCTILFLVTVSKCHLKIWTWYGRYRIWDMTCTFIPLSLLCISLHTPLFKTQRSSGFVYWWTWLIIVHILHTLCMPVNMYIIGAVCMSICSYQHVALKQRLHCFVAKVQSFASWSLCNGYMPYMPWFHVMPPVASDGCFHWTVLFSKFRLRSEMRLTHADDQGTCLAHGWYRNAPQGAGWAS